MSVYLWANLSFAKLILPAQRLSVVRCVIFNLQRQDWSSFRLLHFTTAALPRCIKGSARYLLFHVLRSLADFCKTTSEQELAGRYLFYRTSFEASQNLNNRTSLRMSAGEECWSSVGMQPGNYSQIRQLSRVFSGKPVISQLLTPTGAALTTSVFVWRMAVHISVHLWPFGSQSVACKWKSTSFFKTVQGSALGLWVLPSSMVCMWHSLRGLSFFVLCWWHG